MRTKEEQEIQAKQNLNLTDKDYALYKKFDKVVTLWNEVIDDNSLSENLAGLAGQFRESSLDVSDPEFLNNLALYNRETGRISPFPLSVQELTKDGMIRFLTQLDSMMKPGDELFDFNLLFNGRGYVNSIRKGLSKSNVEFFDTSYINLDKKEKNLKPDEKAKVDAVKKIISKPETKKRIDTFTRGFNIYKKVLDNINLNKTGEEKIEEAFLQEQKNTGILELAAGRSNKLIGRHENYRLLTEIPLKKSDVLPMAGLALLVSNSLSINRNIADSSTQVAQSFKPRPGVVLTEEDQEYIKQMTLASEMTNVGAKIIESAFGGTDIVRMGNRCTAVVEGRRNLNLAAEEYEKGNKQPLIDLVKDSIPVVLSYATDMCNHIGDSSGKAVSEMVDAIETLFANDPDIKKSVGISEADLNKLYAASRFTKKVVYPMQHQKESFNKYMVPGAEDKAAYIREMLYSSFLMSKLQQQVRSEAKRIEKLSNEAIEADLGKISSRITIESNGVPLPEESVMVSLSQGILSKVKRENIKWPEIYSIYEKEPVDEGPLFEEFENSIVNTPEYQELLTQDADQLATTNFESKVSDINNANRKREQEQVMYQKRAAVLNVWDEVLHDYTLPSRLLYLAGQFKDTYVDISDPGSISLLAQYNQETGIFESVPLKGHKEEPGYPSATGFTHDKKGAVDFLFELDYILSDAKNGKELVNYNSIVREESTVVDSFGLNDKNGYSLKVFDSSRKRVTNPPRVVEKPGRFMSFMHAVFGGYKKEFADYDKYLADKAEFDLKSAAEDRKNQASKDFVNAKKADIKRLHDEYKVYSDVNAQIQRNKTIDVKLNEKALEELQTQKTIEVISGRSSDLIGSHPNYRILSNLELENVDELPMQGLALLSANSIEVNKDVSDSSTQWPQEFVFKPGTAISNEGEAFRKQMLLTAECTNIGAKMLDSVFGGSDVQRMGNRMPAVIEARKKLNAAAKAYRDGDKKPLADLIKDSIPAVLSNAKIQTSMILGSSGQAFIEMADSLKELFDKDAEIKALVGVADKDLNKLYAASAFIKKCVYPNKRRNDSFREHMTKGSENKEAYIKEMMYSSYLFNTLSKQTSKINSQVRADVDLMMDDAMKKHGDKIELSEKEKAVYGDGRGNIDTAVRNSLVDTRTPWPEIYSAFEKENGEEQLLKDFEDNIVNSPEYQALLEKSRDELGEINFDKQLEAIYEANAVRKQQETERNIKAELSVAIRSTQKNIDEFELSHGVKGAIADTIGNVLDLVDIKNYEPFPNSCKTMKAVANLSPSKNAAQGMKILMGVLSTCSDDEFVKVTDQFLLKPDKFMDFAQKYPEAYKAYKNAGDFLDTKEKMAEAMARVIKRCSDYVSAKDGDGVTTRKAVISALGSKVLDNLEAFNGYDHDILKQILTPESVRNVKNCKYLASITERFTASLVAVNSMSLEKGIMEYDEMPQGRVEDYKNYYRQLLQGNPEQNRPAYIGAVSDCMLYTYVCKAVEDGNLQLLDSISTKNGLDAMKMKIEKNLLDDPNLGALKEDLLNQNINDISKAYVEGKLPYVPAPVNENQRVMGA